MTIEEFLLERTRDTGMVIAEKIDDITIRDDIGMLLEHQYLIIDWHKNWPILMQTEPEFSKVEAVDPHHIAFNMTQRMEWLTREEYCKRFGEEPPTAPLLRQMAASYSWHPDYDPAWEV